MTNKPAVSAMTAAEVTARRIMYAIIVMNYVRVCFTCDLASDRKATIGTAATTAFFLSSQRCMHISGSRVAPGVPSS